MRVLVTGGHGFIGAHVLRQLVERGHEVACLDVRGPSAVSEAVADEVTLVRGDVTDPVEVYRAFLSFEPDRVVHLASLLGRPSQNDPRRAFEVNVGGTITALEASVDVGVDRFVVASSVAAYGEVPGDVERLDETVVQRPRNVYGLTKYAVERLGATYRDRHGVEFAAVEPVHGIGPDRRRGNVEDAFVLKAAVDGAAVTVPDVGHPYEVVYVEDEARAFVAAALADSLGHDRYVVGTGEMVTLAEVAAMARERVPDAALELADAEGDHEFEGLPPSDASRIRGDLGWEPTHTAEEAVDAYVTWLEENPGAWSFDPAETPWSVG